MSSRKIKAKFRGEFKVWLQDKDGIVEIAERSYCLLLPSIHEDYLKEQVIPQLQKSHLTRIVNNYELINVKRINR